MSELDLQQFRKLLAVKSWRMSHLYKVVDEDGMEVTFTPKPVQVDLAENDHPLHLILKSRQHGITTYKCIDSLDDCLFIPNTRAGIVAHNQEDAAAFFDDKIRFAYDRLPQILKTALPAQHDQAKKLKFTNGSSLRVGTSLRSGTLQRLHVSEFGKLCAKFPEKAKEVVTGALNTVHVGQRISIESTAEGKQGYFYDYCQDAMNLARLGTPLTALDFKFFFFGWWRDAKCWLNPEGVVIPTGLRTYYREKEAELGIKFNDGQKAWYYKKWRLQGDDMKREYPTTPEEAFESSLKGVYYSTQMARVRREGRITKVPVVPQIPVDTYWDLGMNDSTAIVFVQDFGRECRIVDYHENSGEGLAYYARVLKEKGYHYGRHVAPHDIEVRELGTGKSRKEVALGLGIRFETAPRLEVVDGIDAGRNILEVCVFDAERTDPLITALDNYRKEWDDKLGTYKDRPLHDKWSHPADAFRTFATSHRFGRRRPEGQQVPARAISDYDEFATA